MNKSTMIVGIVVLIIVIVVGLFFVSQQSQKSEQAKITEEKAAMKAEEDTMIDKAGDKMVTDKNITSRYVEYSKAVFDRSVNKRRVLYFYASWCPICKPADADFKKNSSKIPEDMVVIRANYNDPQTDQEEKDLAKKYGIIYQHTFVQIDAQGKELTKWNGGQTDELLANIK